MNQESRDMETEIDQLMSQIKTLRRDTFYDDHVDEHYGWKDYQKYKTKEQTKTGKLIKDKEKNLKDQRKSVALVGYRMRDAEMNVAKANANDSPDHIVVKASKRLSVKNPLAAMEMILA